MESIVSAKSLFSEGSDARFWQTVDNVDLASVKFLATPSVVRTDHSDGAPNSSFPSTLDGSLLSACAIVSGLQARPKEFRLFGERISESIDTVRKFYREFLKK